MMENLKNSKNSKCADGGHFEEKNFFFNAKNFFSG
jgi:hypothetical protein